MTSRIIETPEDLKYLGLYLGAYGLQAMFLLQPVPGDLLAGLLRLGYLRL